MVSCPRCGTANAPTHRACIACGTKLQSGLTPDAFGEPNPPPAAPPGAPPDVAAGVPGAPPGMGGPPPMGAPPPGAAYDMNQGAPPGAPGGLPPQAGGAGYGAQPPPFAAEGPTAPPPQQSPAPPQQAPAFQEPVASAAGTVASAQPSSTRGKLVGFLITYELDPAGTFYPLYGGHTLVGRKDAAPGLDIAIEHPTVSSNHAAFHFDTNKHLAQVEDLQSANGTLLNDTAIAGQGRREVRDADRLRLGGVNLVLKLVEPI